MEEKEKGAKEEREEEEEGRVVDAKVDLR